MTDQSPDARPRVSPDALADDLSFLLARANALSVGAGNRALAPFRLRVRSYSALAVAADADQPTQREVADYLRLDPSQVVALIDALEDRGLVRRETDPRDRRSKVVACTAEGRELVAQARVAVRDAERTLHADLSEAERATLSGLLQRLAFPRAEE